jgi:hypothetical protein
MRSPVTGFIMVLATASMSTCNGSSSDKGTHTDGSVTAGTGPLADFEASYIAAFCQYLTRCGMSPSTEACRKSYFDSSLIDLDQLQREIDQGLVTYDAAAATACFSVIANASCAVDAISSTSSTAPSCAGVVKGTIASGGACVSDEQCTTGLCKQPSCGGSCCLGVCAVKAAAGGSCTQSSECVADATCNYDGSLTGTCKPRAPRGEACEYNSDCQSGLTCDSTGSKTCVPLIADGHPCTPGGASCAELSSFCDGTSKTCQPRIRVGAPCVNDTGVLLGSDCVIYAQCRGGVCVAIPTVGEPCQITDGGYAEIACLVGTCTNGSCKVDPSTPCTIASARSPDAGTRD